MLSMSARVRCSLREATSQRGVFVRKARIVSRLVVHLVRLRPADLPASFAGPVTVLLPAHIEEPAQQQLQLQSSCLLGPAEHLFSALLFNSAILAKQLRMQTCSSPFSSVSSPSLKARIKLLAVLCSEDRSVIGQSSQNAVQSSKAL